MLSNTIGIICVLSFIWSIFAGTTGDLAPAILDGTGKAVSVTLSLIGAMSLWSGVMEVLREAGAIRILTKLLKPLTKLLFPNASRTGKGLEPAVTCLSANLLGIGNAATPLGIAALREMQKIDIPTNFNENAPGNFSVSTKISPTARENEQFDPTATDDAMMLTVLCTASFSLVPTTVLALRRAAGAVVIFEIIPKIWLCGIVGMSVGVISVKICQRIFRK